jgi:hypothetical protein
MEKVGGKRKARGVCCFSLVAVDASRESKFQPRVRSPVAIVAIWLKPY